MSYKKTLIEFEKALKLADIPQTLAAEELGVGPTHLNQILRGHRTPSMQLFIKIEEMLSSMKNTRRVEVL